MSDDSPFSSFMSELNGSFSSGLEIVFDDAVAPVSPATARVVRSARRTRSAEQSRWDNSDASLKAPQLQLGEGSMSPKAPMRRSSLTLSASSDSQGELQILPPAMPQRRISTTELHHQHQLSSRRKKSAPRRSKRKDALAAVSV